MSVRKVELKIVADTRELRRQFIRAEIRCTRSRWKRLKLRYSLWHLAREAAP